ncbi:Progonadoliberin-1 [Balearica regulorum gibbericeps]|uniref:Progonadoliberin-1 n=1 Tax=Balearica regulorum gibbericeps TaxID=100784 RepID=A0A087VGH6_BALRE|nr:PREDICTED: progonadoliberin-1 [Balearica regulorum gibbericeps]KFO11718.1 Progonadoliberin-1 [Balearica regulorum gibbericeps]
MDKSRKIFICALLFVMSEEICLAQHWSYGLQPGGKRSAENLAESFQETANEMEKLGEAQKSKCPGSYQHSRFSDLKEAMESLIEGEARRKKI